MDTSFEAPLMDWFCVHKRDLPWRRDTDAYRVWVSEIMLQQTRVAAVIPYYERFLSAYPDVCALANADSETLHKLWEGLGYYSRVNNMRRAAEIAVSQFGGTLPNSCAALLSLPGIGDYTAGAIASIAFGERVPAVDGNVLRVMARLSNDPADISDPKTKRRVRETLAALLTDERTAAHRDPGTFNAAMMELGALVCVPNGAPCCDLCPVAAHCMARAAGTAETLPVKKKLKPRRIEEKTVFALCGSNGLYLGCKRPETGLLAGLWQLPEHSGILTVPEATEQLTHLGLRPLGELSFYRRKHVFTHIEWHMEVCAAQVAAKTPPDGLVWLDEAKALPTAYRVCLPENGGNA